MKWSPRKVSGTKRRANATRRENLVHDNTQANNNLALVPFNRETNQPVNPRHLEGKERHVEFLSKDSVMETQILNQSSSQPIDIIAFFCQYDEQGRGQHLTHTNLQTPKDW